MHLCFYLAALLLAVAGIFAIYRYFTAWSSADDNSHLWDLLLGVLYLVIGAVVVYATYNHGNAHADEETAHRFAQIKDGILTYELDQVSTVQTVALDQIVRVEKVSIRELVLHLKDGAKLVLPIYLIDDEVKQRELESLLRADL